MIQLTGEVTYNPRRLFQKVINGLETEAFEDRTAWLCSACDLCYDKCPQEIHVSDVLLAVKELAIEAGHESPLEAAIVNEGTCVACGLCVSLCPYEAISLVEKKAGQHTFTVASVDAEHCMACGLCAASCRSASIEVPDQFSNQQVMDSLWEWMERTAPAPIPVSEVPEWAVVPDTVS
jgi:heterodisulfide reductase subunit C